MKKYKLRLRTHFDSAHKLELGYDSRCTNIHGHRWKVIIEIISGKLNKDGMIVDFKRLKEIVDKLDHRYLNDMFTFNPTAENISEYLYHKIKRETGFNAKVTIYESPDASITYGNY